jgi:hypothetical protein
MAFVADFIKMLMKGKRILKGYELLMGWLIGMIAIALLFMCSGCTTIKTVEVEKVRTDTLIVTKQQRDSIYIEQRDSIVLHSKGDTVTIDRWHWRDRWRERVVRDTIYRSKTDTVVVNRSTGTSGTVWTWWQRVKHDAWKMALGAALVIIMLFVARVYKIFRP